MRIRTEGLGEYDHDVRLGKLALVVGANGSGKTKLAEAVRLVALGYSPAFGKRPADTADLMHGSKMSVLVEPFDDGRTAEFRLKSHGKGYRTERRASWLEEKATSPEHAAAAMALFGREESEIAELMHIESLTHATPNQRDARIQELIESAVDPERTVRAFGRYALARLAGREDDIPANYKALRSSIPGYSEDGDHEGQYALLREVAARVKQALRQGIADAINLCNVEKRKAAGDMRELKAARREFEARMKELGEVSDDEIAKLTKRSQELQRRIGGVEERLLDVRRAAKRIREAEALVARKEDALAEAERERGFFEEDDDRETQLDRIDLCDSEIAKIKEGAEPATPDVAELETDLAALDEEISSTKVPDVPEPSVALELELREARGRLETGGHPAWAQVLELVSEIESLVVGSKASAKTKKSVSALAEDVYGLAREGGAESRAVLDEALASIETRKEEECSAIAHAEAEQSKAQGKLDDLRAKGEALSREIHRRRDEHAQQLSQRTGEIHRLIEERNALRTAVSDRNAADVRTAAAVERANDDLEAARRRVKEIRGDGNDDSEALEAENEQLGQESREVASRLRHLNDIRAKRDELDRLRRDLLRAEDAFTVYSAGEWACQRVRDDEINRSGGIVAEVMREFLAAAGREETPVIQAGTLGWRRADDSIVRVGALSGGEFSLFSTALAAALIVAQGADARVLLVEADGCDEQTLPQLLAGTEAIADRLTSVLVTRWSMPKSVPAGWSLVEFGADGQVREAA